MGALPVDEDPADDSAGNMGEIDYLAIDKNGNLVIGESGFFDTVAGSMAAPTGSGGLTAQQPRVATLGIESYADPSGEIRPAGYTASGGAVGFDTTGPNSPWSISNHVPVLPGGDDTQVLGGAQTTATPPIPFDGTKVAYDAHLAGAAFALVIWFFQVNLGRGSILDAPGNLLRQLTGGMKRRPPLRGHHPDPEAQRGDRREPDRCDELRRR